MKIFVVDDEAFMRDAVSSFLKKKFPQAEISGYTTGEDALHNLFTKPDLIILDYYLDLDDDKAENGIEILKKIKNVLPHIPVILLSGQENPSIAADTIRYGAYDYVVKDDNAYHRLQLIVEKIYGYRTIHKKLWFQRVFNVVLLLLVIAFILYRFLGNWK
jgi:two-component system OmpR family response regulator